MCQQNHEFSLTNIESGEVVNHELLLIKGIVTNQCKVDNISIKNLNTNSIIYQNLNSIRSGYFKFLVQLLENEKNHFELSYCNQSYKFEIDYMKSFVRYQIQPLYIICKNHDGTFNSCFRRRNDISEACKIIGINMKLVQSLYAEKLFESGFGRKTFTIASDCLVFYSNLDVEEALKLDENSLWNRFAYEIINSELGTNTNLKFIAFIGCTKYDGHRIEKDFSYENIKRHTRANAALGGGGLALFGSGCFYSWPSNFIDIIHCFKDTEKIDLKLYLDESNYRRTLGGCYATSLGAVCHEIGHCFDLGHTENGIMGNGFDYVNHVFTIEKLTENLPERIVNSKHHPHSAKDDRLTNVKKNTNKFLEKYHEQKKSGDSTYFSRNCAIILAHHKWLNANDSIKDDDIQLQHNQIQSDNFIILIEIRQKVNGLVLHFFEFINKHMKIFELPDHIYDKVHHNLFVETISGSVKLFD